MPLMKPGYIEDSKRLGTLQRAFLDSSQKRKGGAMNAGANGINTLGYQPPGTIGKEGQPIVQYTNTDTVNTGQTSNPTGSTTTDSSGLSGLAKALAAVMASAKGAAATDTGSENSAKTTNSTSTTNTNTNTTNPAAAAAGGFQFSGDYAADAQKLLTQYQAIVSTPFSYNKETDPSYLAAKQSLEQGAAAAKDQTYADMAARGILSSSITTGQLGSIQQRAVESLAQVVPGLEANAYNRHMANVNNQAGMLQMFLGQLNHQQSFEADERYRAADLRFKDAEIDGTYESPEMMKLMNDIVNYKKTWAGTTDPTERTKAAEAAKVARAQLAGLTGRSQAEIEAMFGANIGIDQALANFSKAGVSTMQSKMYEEEKQRYLDDKTYRDNQWTYAKDQDQKNWDFKTKEFNENLRHNKAMETKSSASSGPSPSDLSRLISQNTDRIIHTMISDGVKDVNSALAWINDPNHPERMQDVYSGFVNPGALTDYFKPNGSTKSGPDDYTLWQDAEKAAQNDPRVKGSPNDWNFVPPTGEAYDAIVKEWYEKLKNRAYPKPAPAKGDPLKGLYELAQKYLPNLFPKK